MMTALSKRLLGGFALLIGVTYVSADDWPQWRGPNRDNKVTGFKEPTTWPKELTKKWKVAVGEGLASPALVGDKLYVFSAEGSKEVIRCLDVADGKELWKDTYSTGKVSGIAGSAGSGASVGPRTATAVADGKVCTFGVSGVLSCLDANSGKVLWRNDTKDKPKFYTASSPLITEGLCIAHTGADRSGALTAFDLATGEKKWKWDADGPSYGSPVLMTVDGVKQVVELTDKNLVGVSLADGKLLWKVAFTQGRYQTATPIIDGSMVICSGTAYTIEKKDNEFIATKTWKDKAPHQYSTPVLKDGVLYGFTTGTGGGGGGGGRGGSSNFYCQDAKTGKVLWTDNAAHGECGYILDLGTVLAALSSDSKLIVFKPNKEAFTEVAKYKVSDSATWTEPIIAGNRIFVKDKDSVTLWTIE
jgi:outer membrane protein assembly factor BamB